MYKSIIRRHILYFIIICLFIFFTTLLGIGCPMRQIFNIPCPTCGVTRATMALIRLDISGYLYFHPLALPLLASVWLMLHKNLFKKQKVILVSVTTVFIANLVLYAVRLAMFSIP